jgi:hypothetical protein
MHTKLNIFLWLAFGFLGQNLGLVPRIHSVSGAPLPSPRIISNNVHDEGMNHLRSKLFTVALTHFGQFIDHDVISTPILIGKFGS